MPRKRHAFFSEPLLIAFLASIFFFLSACTQEAPSSGAAGSISDSVGLNRVLEPLGYKGGPLTQQQADGAKNVHATYQFLIGQYLSGKGDSNKALVAFDRVRKVDENSSFLHNTLAQEFLKKGMVSEGVASVRKAIELNSANRDAKHLLATLLTTAKKYGEAAVIYEDLIKSDPEDEEAHLYLVLLDLEQRNVSRAQERLERLIKNNPDSALGHFYLARIEHERGNKKRALELYQNTIELKAGFTQAGSYLGALQEENGDTLGATETYSWLAAQGESAAFHVKLGQLHLKQNQLEAALNDFQNAERLDESDAENKMRVALLHLQLKHYKQAKNKFKEVLKLHPDNDQLRYYLATTYMQMEQLSDALDEFEKVPLSSKLYLESLRNRLGILTKLKKNKEALTLWTSAFNEALRSPAGTSEKQHKISAELYQIGAAFFESNKDISRALRLVSEGLQAYPKNELLLYTKASLLEKKGQGDEALQMMQALIKVNPKNAAALNFVGYMWAERNQNLLQAEKYIRRALTERPEDPFILDSLGWVLFRQGRLDEAQTTLERALAAAPGESVIADHLGDVLVKRGDIGEAKRYYEMALKAEPEKEEDHQKIRAKIEVVGTMLPKFCALDPHRCRGLRQQTPEKPTERQPAASAKN